MGQEDIGAKSEMKSINKKIKKNCWEVKQCGREPGGNNIDTLGVCPAAQDVSSDGMNGGKNGGRICWAISGTFCKGEVQGIFAMKIESCLHCEVFKAISEEEGASFVMHPEENCPVDDTGKYLL